MSPISARRAAIPAVVAAAGLFLAACGGDAGGGANNAPSDTAPELTLETTTDTQPAEDGGNGGETDGGTEDRLSAADVAAAALDAVPGDVVGLDIDRGDGDAEVTVLRTDGTGAEVRVNLRTGEADRVRDEDLDTEEQTAPAVSATDAMTIALEEAGGSIDDMELDTEDGIRVWEVKVISDGNEEFEIRIDADSGEVLRTERD